MRTKFETNRHRYSEGLRRLRSGNAHSQKEILHVEGSDRIVADLSKASIIKATVPNRSLPVTNWRMFGGIAVSKAVLLDKERFIKEASDLLEIDQAHTPTQKRKALMIEAQDGSDQVVADLSEASIIKGTVPNRPLPATNWRMFGGNHLDSIACDGVKVAAKSKKTLGHCASIMVGRAPHSMTKMSPSITSWG